MIQDGSRSSRLQSVAVARYCKVYLLPAALARCFVAERLASGFVGEHVAGSLAVSHRVTALDHEVRDDALEGGSVLLHSRAASRAVSGASPGRFSPWCPRERDEVGDGPRRFLAAEPVGYAPMLVPKTAVGSMGSSAGLTVQPGESGNGAAAAGGGGALLCAGGLV